jgi:hypothetical protein
MGSSHHSSRRPRAVAAELPVSHPAVAPALRTTVKQDEQVFLTDGETTVLMAFRIIRDTPAAASQSAVTRARISAAGTLFCELAHAVGLLLKESTPLPILLPTKHRTVRLLQNSNNHVGINSARRKSTKQEPPPFLFQHGPGASVGFSDLLR